MLSGVAVIEFRVTRGAPVARTVRVLVRNADNVHEAIIRGIAAAIELVPVHQRAYQAAVVDWCGVQFDLVA